MPVKTAAMMAIVLVLLVASIISGAMCQCPVDCVGCGTTSVTCVVRSPFQDYSLISSQVQALNFRCVTGGELGLSRLEQQVPGLQDLMVNGCLFGFMESVSFPTLQTLNLSSNTLTRVDVNGLPQLTMLDVSQNRIQSLPQRVFRNSGRLETLDLSHNELKQVPDLDGLTSLNTLVLTNNLITELGSAFVHTPSLELITLSYNEIKEIKQDSLASLAKLRELDISYNRVESVQISTSLHTLNLAGNKLRIIDPISFPFVVDLDLSNNLIQTVAPSFTQFLQNVQKVDLAGNPLHCNCELEHLRTFYLTHRNTMSSLSCKTPARMDLASAMSPLTCTLPVVTIRQVGEGLLCEAKGDPAPTVTWLDADTEATLVTASPAGDDASVTVNEAEIDRSLLQNHQQLVCSAANRMGATEETSFIFHVGANTTTSSSDNDSVPMSMFIGCLVGVFVGTLCLVIYIVICCKFCKCRKKKDEPSRAHSQMNGHRPFYAQPNVSPKKRKKDRRRTPRPWEFPPHHPHNYPQPYLHHPYGERPPEESVYATIPENPRATIEELPSDDDTDMKEEGILRTPRIIELTDTPSTSCTNLQQSTPADSADPLPGLQISPDPTPTPTRNRNRNHNRSRDYTPSNTGSTHPDVTFASNSNTANSHPASSNTANSNTASSNTANSNTANPTTASLPSANSSRPSVSSAPPDVTTSASVVELSPNVFAMNRHAADKVGFFSTPTSRSSSMIISGELFTDPRPFNGIHMEQTSSQEFGHEINV